VPVITHEAPAMTRSFNVYLPIEQSRVRRVRLATEVLDGVTLSRVSEGLALTAHGLRSAPIVNAGGLFVWLEEGGREPVSVGIDTGWLPFDPQVATVPALPERLLRVELAPQRAYPFPGGATGIRGRLVQNRTDNPPIPVAGAPAWLQWIDDSLAGTTWVDAPVRGQTDGNGDFAATARFTPAQVPRLAQGRLRVRLAGTRAGTTLKSPELQIPEGRITDVSATFAWNEFQP
jgi:hypothetical protein